MTRRACGYNFCYEYAICTQKSIMSNNYSSKNNYKTHWLEALGVGDTEALKVLDIFLWQKLEGLAVGEQGVGIEDSYC